MNVTKQKLVKCSPLSSCLGGGRATLCERRPPRGRATFAADAAASCRCWSSAGKRLAIAWPWSPCRSPSTRPGLRGGSVQQTVETMVHVCPKHLSVRGCHKSLQIVCHVHQGTKTITAGLYGSGLHKRRDSLNYRYATYQTERTFDKCQVHCIFACCLKRRQPIIVCHGTVKHLKSDWSLPD